MKPHLHGRLSVKKYGGKLEDYEAIHEFIDHSKSSMPDVRHRAMLHSSWGIYLVSQVFGNTITNSEGKLVSTRDVAEDHILQDLGFIPTVQDWLKNLPIEGWMSGTQKRRQVLSFTENQPKENIRDVYLD